VDVFYVTDLTGKKIGSTSRESLIRERLTRVLVETQEPELEFS
jgi:[protein-PII] uridylyltransferase